MATQRQGWDGHRSEGSGSPRSPRPSRTERWCPTDRPADPAGEAAGEAAAWRALARFIEGIVDADVHSLTVHPAGTFTPTEAMRELAASSNRHVERLFRRARAAGVIRPDLHLNDIVMVFEQLAAVRLGDAERTRALRRRSLVLQLDALRADPVATKLPGRAPTNDELGARWAPRGAAGG